MIRSFPQPLLSYRSCSSQLLFTCSSQRETTNPNVLWCWFWETLAEVRECKIMLYRLREQAGTSTWLDFEAHLKWRQTDENRSSIVFGRVGLESQDQGTILTVNTENSHSRRKTTLLDIRSIESYISNFFAIPTALLHSSTFVHSCPGTRSIFPG